MLSRPFLKKKSVYLFLKFSGPTFLKLGQILSTRPDLVGDELAATLSIFQDKLPPFPLWRVKKIISSSLGKKVEELFAEFSPEAIASASIAQVHKAQTYQKELVAVKILRPNITRLMKRDIATLKLLLRLVSFFSVYLSEKIKDVVWLLSLSAKRELDLLNEAAAASELKERLSDVEGFYIPKIYWNLSSSKVLVMEWIEGIPFSDLSAIRNGAIDKDRIAKNLAHSYFNQVYVQGFFHADMHPGNLFLMKNGTIAVVDFGIIGIIDKQTRRAVAEILVSYLQRDYHRVAQIHIESGLVPYDTNLEEFALSCRAIGEDIIDLPVKQISLAKLMSRLLKMTKKYNITTRPELLLLQKTMMLVEGVGMTLNENFNMWELSAPWAESWAEKNLGFDARLKDNMLEFWQMFKNLPFAVTKQQYYDELAKRNNILQEKINKEKANNIVKSIIIVILTIILLFKFLCS